ncbi:MAG: hypothetical protein A2X13_12465 [Bacteroidetes bacterium GWC2_33_15]|nr:MAG: hypothetical protein A2X10_14230 [Bacteroidetes bacterium GWA2_33_15]OFX50603.1 MAG: hypothetical protein A2X13_12465 [Bacteroidetes bacterium GWC2_33_15]OFX64140.1 MAG: hypothetical protein A2X15_02915 [Bacteroidetes bacterium GWB2_32_14]OFX69752.1 MAG: hypothetical protein A2X14_05140 [Bacteroidetes bacterium GWD2_33_33]HAN19789.1 hypothetical protein [Bacteroidales bacterium]
MQGPLIKIDGLEIACENCGEIYTIYVKSSDDNNGLNFGTILRAGEDKNDEGYIVPDPNYIENILENKAALRKGLRKGIRKYKGGIKGGFETE